MAWIKPDCVLAMGGYVSVPPVLAAKIFRIPIVLHEQNVIPGLANRLLGRVANQVALSFEESRGFFRVRPVVTGNPIREVFYRLPERAESLKKWGLRGDFDTLLVFGGSLGAHQINEWMVEALGKLGTKGPTFQVLHFTGLLDEDWVKEAYHGYGVSSVVSAFCHEMEWAYAACDLVLCRAGATTIAELKVVQKPAILIPYPFATGNHQLENANVLSRLGRAETFEQKNLDGKKLKEILVRYMGNPNLLAGLKKRCETLHSSERRAADHIKDLIIGIV